MTPRVLYLGAVDGWKPKLAGVRRYATRRGWEVLPVSTVGMPYAEIPAVLERMRPDGCIVGCNGGNYFPGKRLFGTVPVVYLDLPARTPGASSCRIVSCDDDAVVRTPSGENAGRIFVPNRILRRRCRGADSIHGTQNLAPGIVRRG